MWQLEAVFYFLFVYFLRILALHQLSLSFFLSINFSVVESKPYLRFVTNSPKKEKELI
jgi:hypothetical protein